MNSQAFAALAAETTASVGDAMGGGWRSHEKSPSLGNNLGV